MTLGDYVEDPPYIDVVIPYNKDAANNYFLLILEFTISLSSFLVFVSNLIFTQFLLLDKVQILVLTVFIRT